MISLSVADILRQTRKDRNLSQRELSAASGVPQSHISKIEQGAVDLRLSSLVELARTLGLEVVLVPRQAVPAVESIVRSSTPSSVGAREAGQARRELGSLARAIADNRSALPLKPEELARLRRRLRELGRFQLSDSDRKAIREADREIRAHLAGTKDATSVRKAVAHIEDLRNALAHGAAHPAGQPEPVRPAYGLDEDENA